MVPLTFSQRKLLLKYIPELTPKDINEYENLIALRCDNIHLYRLSELPARTDEADPPYDPDHVPDQIETVKSNIQDKKKQKRLPDKDHPISKISQKLHGIIRPYERRFAAHNRLSMARLQAAVQMGSFQQNPVTYKGIKNTCRTIVNSKKAAISCAFILTDEKILRLVDNKNWVHKLVWTGLFFMAFLVIITVAGQLPGNSRGIG